MPIIETKKVNLYYSDFHALKNISMGMEKNTVTALIGPSGCGKSTYLRLFNRMNDLIDGVKITGDVLVENKTVIYRTTLYVRICIPWYTVYLLTVQPDFWRTMLFSYSEYVVSPCHFLLLVVDTFIIQSLLIMFGSSPQSGTPTSAGHKRYHVEGPSWSFVISQESAADDDCRQANASNKRQRMNQPDSPGVVSISSMRERSSDPRRLDDALGMSECNNVEWWRQKHVFNRAPERSTTTPQATCCFLCQRPRQQQIHHPLVVPSNSILSYFPPRKASTATVPMNMSTVIPVVESFHSCSFCDRQACASCTRQCEICSQTFCSLCSTVDYSGRMERNFCLDCLATRTTDDAMHVD